MEKCYFNLNSTKDKAIHLLYAGFIFDYYEESVNECIKAFGEEKTQIAVFEFNKKFKSAGLNNIHKRRNKPIL